MKGLFLITCLTTRGNVYVKRMPPLKAATLPNGKSTSLNTWAKTKDGRKLILLYDLYIRLITLRVLRILKDGGGFSYCFPAHTSGKSKPLQVWCFSPFKNVLSSNVHNAHQHSSPVEFEQFDLVYMMKRAYKKAFFVQNVQKNLNLFGFGRSTLTRF